MNPKPCPFCEDLSNVVLQAYESRMKKDGRFFVGSVHCDCERWNYLKVQRTGKTKAEAETRAIEAWNRLTPESGKITREKSSFFGYPDEE